MKFRDCDFFFFFTKVYIYIFRIASLAILEEPNIVLDPYITTAPGYFKERYKSGLNTMNTAVSKMSPTDCKHGVLFSS